MKGYNEGQITLAQNDIIPLKGYLILSKQPTYDRENNSMDMESMQKMIKKLSNEIVDIKRSIREGTSNKKPYSPFVKIPNPRRAIEPPPANLNLDI